MAVPHGDARRQRFSGDHRKSNSKPVRRTLALIGDDSAGNLTALTGS
jgi:hypothetical protein